MNHSATAAEDATEPADGMVWVPARGNHRRTYHTGRCPAVKDARSSFVARRRGDLDDAEWTECKKCAGKCDKSDPKRECPLCGDVYVLGRHLPECDGGDGS
jgi:hypothetical protein